ncbi:hypothetical protein SALBM311S_06421 [Streptomyces alboniger]
MRAPTRLTTRPDPAYHQAESNRPSIALRLSREQRSQK